MHKGYKVGDRITNKFGTVVIATDGAQVALDRYKVRHVYCLQCKRFSNVHAGFLRNKNKPLCWYCREEYEKRNH